MKKLLLISLTIFLSVIKAQEKKYLLMERKFFFIYTPKADGSFLRESYFADYNKMVKNSETFTPSREEAEKIYKESVLLSTVQTDEPKIFKYFINKPFTVKNKQTGKTSKFCFYGSDFLKEDQPSANFGENLITPSNWTKGDELPPYMLFQAEGKTFFIMDGFVYPFRKDKILQSIFPDTEVKFTDKNFASIDCQRLVKVVNKPGDADESFFLYGVETVNGVQVLPPAFEKIYIAADAILVKNKGLWYFYDFFGNKIMEKGFRKILPLYVKEEVRNFYYEEGKLYRGGMVNYVVLDKNEIKIIDNVYKEAKNSDFISLWRIFAICGTRSSRRIEESSSIRIDGNTISINKRTDVYGYGYISAGQTEDKVMLNVNQAVDLDKNTYGELSYLNKVDSSFVFSGVLPNQYYYFFKSKKGNRQKLKVLRSTCADEKCSAYFLNVDEFPTDGMDLSYDNIEDFRPEISLLTLAGNYTESFNFNKKLGEKEDNNLFRDSYYKLYDKGRVGLFSPRSVRLRDVRIKYKKLEDLKNRFARFEDENGKTGWLSEDNEEFYDL